MRSRQTSLIAWCLGLVAALAIAGVATAEPFGANRGVESPPPPAQRPLPAGHLTGVTPPGTPGSGTCPNNTSYAYDPRTGRCVALPPCPGGLVYNPDRGQCVPRAPGGGLECLDGYGFSAVQNRCVAPDCGSQVFDPQRGRCAPAAPVLCPPGLMYDYTRKQCLAVTYTILQFVFGTGGDDLRTDSELDTSILLPNGARTNCTLKMSGDNGWGNNSSHTATCELTSGATLAQLKQAKVSLNIQGGGGAGMDDPDNWDMQSIAIGAYNQGDRRPPCVFSSSGGPLYRFTYTDNLIVTDLLPNTCPP